MKIGKNIARIIDYGMTKTKGGMPQVFVKLSMTEENEETTWYGMPFKKDEDVNEIFFMQLAYCGFDPAVHTLEKLALGVDSGILVTDEDIDVYVRKETAPDGTDRLRVNTLGEIGPNRVDEDAVKDLINADQLAKLKGLSGKIKPKSRKKKADPAEVVPF